MFGGQHDGLVGRANWSLQRNHVMSSTGELFLRRSHHILTHDFKTRMLVEVEKCF